MVEELCNDYANYMKVDLLQQLGHVQETVDDMLTRLDEFENLVDMVKSDSELCAYLSIPTIMQSKEKLEMLFSQVDSLEKFVNHVKSDANTVESQLNIAEEEIGQNSGSLKNMFRPLFFKKSPTEASSVPRQNRSLTYEAPTLFSTSDFFPSQSKDLSQKEQQSSQP